MCIAQAPWSIPAELTTLAELRIASEEVSGNGVRVHSPGPVVAELTTLAELRIASEQVSGNGGGMSCCIIHDQLLGQSLTAKQD